MSILSRLRALRSPDAACARALFAGRGLGPGVPPGPQALAHVLEVAAGPGTPEELAGEVAAAAAFVQVTSRVKPRRTARLALAAAACAVAVGAAAVYASVVPSPHHKSVPVPFGVPASHHAIPAPVATRPPGRWHASPRGHAGVRPARPASSPDVPQRSGGR